MTTPRIPRPCTPVLLAFVLLFLLLPLPSQAQVLLRFEALLRQALRHSFALQISRSDLALRRLDLEEAQTLYRPTLALRYDLGYAWDLAGGQEVVTIGDSVSANNSSTWQNSLDLTASLPLYDFGAREQRIAGARQRVRAAVLGQAEPLMQLRYAVLDIYAQGLQVQRRVRALTDVLARRQLLYRTVEQLQAAGTASRTQLQEAALRLAAALTRLDDARAEEVRVLAALTELTGDNYPLGQVTFSPLPPATAEIPPAVVIEALPQVRALDAELARLRAERSVILLERLPALALSGGWRFYGAERDGVGRTLSELAERDATVALVARWEFYSGGRSQLQLAKTEEQLHRLALQRQQRIAELEREIGAMRAATAHFVGSNGHLEQRQQAMATAAEATERLRSEGALAQTAALEREIDLLEDELEADLLRLKQQTDVVRLNFWAEEWGS